MVQSSLTKPAPGEMTAFMASRLRAGLTPGQVATEAASKFGRDRKKFDARVYQIQEAIKAGKNPGASFTAAGAPPQAQATQKKNGYDRLSKFTPEHVAILEQLVRDFTEGNYVNFRAAFAAHPEWKEALSRYPKSTTYGYARRLRLKLSTNGQAGHALARRAETSPIAPEPIATHPAGRSLICCPKCGENVERWENLSPLLSLPAHVIERLVKMASSVKAMKGASL
jgi:hypothetical protein